eukprot:GHUV01041927.1.p3 GENE.GHUV01041927.1~~GHUV01041927.1.p3  ORF type:complete len:154 (+),score=67.82 GHUV01041927.1:470-931(+)
MEVLPQQQGVQQCPAATAVPHLQQQQQSDSARTAAPAATGVILLQQQQLSDSAQAAASADTGQGAAPSAAVLPQRLPLQLQHFCVQQQLQDCRQLLQCQQYSTPVPGQQQQLFLRNTCRTCSSSEGLRLCHSTAAECSSSCWQSSIVPLLASL